MKGHACAVTAENGLRHRTVSSHFFLKLNEAAPLLPEGNDATRIGM
jgi:hypothetical protein